LEDSEDEDEARKAPAAEGEGPLVTESELERLYRLNEEYYRTLPEFEGPVPHLRGV
jgi:hypothetical protein